MTDLNRESPARLEEALRSLRNPVCNSGDELLTKHERQLRAVASSLSLGLELLPSLRRQACHFDLHLGNVLWKEGKLSAILDWDWSRIGEWYGVDWAASIAMCCSIYEPTQVNDALSALRKGFGPEGRLPDRDERWLLVASLRSYVFAQFLFTCFHYLEAPSIEARFIDVRHFLFLVVENDFEALIAS